MDIGIGPPITEEPSHTTWHTDRYLGGSAALVLEEGEGYTLEFKQNINTDFSKELVAFANASGGRIFIGVDDHNRVVGCDFSNALFSKIDTMAAACDPPVAIFIEKLPDKKLVFIYLKEQTDPIVVVRGFI